MEYIEKELMFGLLVIDDFGLMEYDLDNYHDLFDMVDGSDEREVFSLRSNSTVCIENQLWHRFKRTERTVFSEFASRILYGLLKSGKNKAEQNMIETVVYRAP